MDSLPEDEIEAIWQRSKRYLDLNKIKSVSRKMIQEEIREEMRNANVPRDRERNPQALMDFLIFKGFPEEAASNDKIVNELLSDNVKEIKVKGKTRFQIAKGTPSFTTPEGKTIRAGQFIGGGTKEGAIKNLRSKGGV
jgi:hypothetical protein